MQKHYLTEPQLQLLRSTRRYNDQFHAPYPIRPVEEGLSGLGALDLVFFENWPRPSLHHMLLAHITPIGARALNEHEEDAA